MSAQEHFAAAYAKLNTQQKIAVDAIEGPVMVVAGPGTGKTQVLATRIANILRLQDVEPSSILALTFTDAAAQNMRKRVVSLVGKAGYYVTICTFHSFAAEVIQDHPEHFPNIDIQAQPLEDIEKLEIFQEILIDLGVTPLTPLNKPFLYVSHSISAVAELKRENIDPDQFEAVVAAEEQVFENEREDLTKTKRAAKEKVLAKQKELVTIYTKYNQKLIERSRYDFEDMISLVAKAFAQNEELLLEYQERFLYFLVDEYQDTNAAQNSIVQKLASHWGDQANIFVVGDPHQSIYRFQGASIENTLRFLDTYQKALVVTLSEGYRCPQPIYDAAWHSIGYNHLQVEQQELLEATQQKLSSARFSAAKDGFPISLHKASSEQSECLYIAQQIKELLEKGSEPHEIAVLCKKKTAIQELLPYLDAVGIPYEASSGKDVLSNTFITQLLALFELIESSVFLDKPELFFTLALHHWVPIQKTALFKLSRMLAEKKVSLLELLSSAYETLNTSDITQEEFSEIVAFKDMLLEWHATSKTEPFSWWFSAVIGEQTPKLHVTGSSATGFGLLRHILESPQKVDAVLAINTLYSFVKKRVRQRPKYSLADFLHDMQIYAEHNLSLIVDEVFGAQSKVSIWTVHKAKGMEWEHVFLYNCADTSWGNVKNRNGIPLPGSLLTNTDISKKEKNEDERRIFYVALTRARKKIWISYPEARMKSGKVSHVVPSMFLSEIEPVLSKVVISENQPVLFDELVRTMQQPQLFRDTDATFKEYLQVIVNDFVFSPTALDSYLRDPEQFILHSLLRVPRAKGLAASYGTAVHAALEKLHRHYMQHGLYPQKEVVFAAFEQALKKESLTERDYEHRKSEGFSQLGFYYEQVASTSSTACLVEQRFGSSLKPLLLTTDGEPIKLSGRVDRIDLLDKKRKTVRFVDYKTASAKSEGVILGKSGLESYSERELSLPESIKGRYYRQLVFYKLLSNLDSSFRFEMVEGQIDFVSASGTNKDKHIRRTFTIPDQAVSDLTELLRQVSAELRTMAFLEYTTHI